MRPALRASGFTLIELMIVLVTSSLVIAGAFSLHTTLSRQNDRMGKVADVQQTLRIARQYVEKQLRLAGQGMGGKEMVVPMSLDGTTCSQTTIGGVMVHNLNYTYPFPTRPFPVDAGNTSAYDPDPDWIEFAYMDLGGNGTTVKSVTGQGQSVELTVNNCQSLLDQGVSDCQGMLNLSKPGAPSCPYALSNIQCSAGHIQINPQHCGSSPCLATIANRSPSDCSCNDTVGSPNYNPDYVAYKNAHPTTPSGQLCGDYMFGMQVATLGPGVGGIRLFAAGEGPANYPFTMLQRATLVSQVLTWAPLTEMVEDLQFEVFLANGTIVGQYGNRRDLTQAEWPQMRAIRYTLVGRSRAPVTAGFTQTIAPYADRPGGTYTDGYLRRTVSGVVQLRNYGL